jgi:hypothetical protein
MIVIFIGFAKVFFNAVPAYAYSAKLVEKIKLKAEADNNTDNNTRLNKSVINKSGSIYSSRQEPFLFVLVSGKSLAHSVVHNGSKVKSAEQHYINLNAKLYSVNYFKKHKKKYKAALKECKQLNYQFASLTAKNNCSKAIMLKFFKVIKIKKSN